MLFRYPGGKSRLAPFIVDVLIGVLEKITSEKITSEKISCSVSYSEPFFGAGHVGLRLLDKLGKSDAHLHIDKFCINDADYGIYAIWKSIVDDPTSLVEKVRAFTPSEDLFYLFKEDLLYKCDQNRCDKLSASEIALRKIAIHQMSYSGLGLKAGGPIGGKLQASAYGVGCRWNAQSLIKKINKIGELLRIPGEVVVSSLDSQRVLNYDVVYLDPPYFDKGNDLYHCGFSVADHENLAAALKSRTAPWVLSYDDCEFVRDTYPGNIFKVYEVPTTYTICSARKRSELLIVNF